MNQVSFSDYKYSDYQISCNEYGVFKGNSTLFLIETGKGGSIYGYQNKYLRIASAIHRQFGYSVAVFSNPETKVCDLEQDLKTAFYLNEGYQEVLFTGVSYGGSIGIQQGWKFPFIRQMLLINAPLMINWHKTKQGILQLSGEQLLFVYGTKDPSYPYTPFLQKIKSSSLKLKLIEKANHNFAGMNSVFEELIMNFAEGKA